jgi:hypothetical protein
MKGTYISALVLAALVILSPSGFAMENHEGIGSGRDFGQHVAAHTREAHLDGDMNPGNHHGYSIFVA